MKQCPIVAARCDATAWFYSSAGVAVIMGGFEELTGNRKVLSAISDMGWREPTPIQAASVPAGLSGRDVLGRAQTGSGKTGAYGIVIIARTKPGSKLPTSLVVVPTRELAEQVSGELQKLSKNTNHIIASVFGGASAEGQIRKLAHGCDIVVGTPGRILDLHRRDALDLSNVRELVLDEADRMLDMGFSEDVMSIVSLVPGDRQTLMYSATLSDAVAEVASGSMRDPERISIAERTVPPKVKQLYVVTERKDKIHRLNEVISTNRKIIVFCSTRKMVEELYRRLSEQGSRVGAIHGEMPQRRRDATIAGFRRNSMPILVATDVAARGMDIEDVEVVVNYDSPYDAEDYVHRIGRAGRAGRTGWAVTFITPSEDRRLPAYEEYTKTRIKRVRKDGIAYEIGVREVREKEPKKEEAGTSLPKDLVSITVDLGRDSGIDRNALARIVMDSARVPRDRIGKIGISKDRSFIEVSKDDADRIIASLNRFRFNGKPLRSRYAPSKKRPHPL